MMGTGIYLEDVETTLAVIALCGAVLNISEHRSADAKLKRLARQVVESQEQERARLSASCTTASARCSSP